MCCRVDVKGVARREGPRAIVARSAFLSLISLVLLTSLASASVSVYSDDFSGDTLSPYWTVNNQIPYSSVSQSDGVLRIESPVAPSGNWYDTGVVGGSPLSASSFTASVDFRIPEGNSMPWLFVSQSPLGAWDSNQFGVYLWNRHGYNVWYHNDDYNGWVHGRDGVDDETETWHNLKIRYDAPTEVISAYVNNIFLHSAVVPLDNFVVTLKMKDRDIYGSDPSVVEFDNFRFCSHVVPEPSTWAIFLVFGGLMLFIGRGRARRLDRS